MLVCLLLSHLAFTLAHYLTIHAGGLLKYAVFAEVPGQTDELGQPQFASIGYLSKNSETEQGEKIEQLLRGENKADLGTLSVAGITPGLEKDDVKAAFNQVWDYDEQVRSNIPDSELDSYAAAMWSLTHTRTDGTEASANSDFRTASVAFGIFAPEIQSRLQQLQFKDLTVTGVRLNEYQGKSFNKERLPISVEFATDPNDPNQNQRVVKVEGKVLGSFTGESPQLPVGTTAIATLETPLGATAIATLTDGETIRIGTLKNYPYAQTNFNGLPGTITLGKEWKNDSKFSYVARLDGQILGELKDPESKKLLEARNLLVEGTRLNVILSRESSSVANVTIDPDTVVYPQIQTHDRALSTSERPPELLPTLWSQSEAGVTIAVDNRKTENLIQFFDRYSVPVTFVQDAAIERELGYAVARFESLSEPVYSKLQTKFGEPLATETYQQCLKDVAQGNFELTGRSLSQKRSITISGKPVAMNYDLKLHGEPNPLPVGTTIEAMRGHGRIHTTRNFEPYRAYGFKEGDYAIAYSGQKENPTQQVLFRVGKQYQITREMISDPQYRQTWADVEKHSAGELDTFRDKPAWGLYYEPIGDYKNGKVYDFGTGQEITALQARNSDVVPKIKPTDLTQLIPISSKEIVEKNRIKDRAMAQVATQFIGFPSQSNLDVTSSTRDYQQAWGRYGLANTGNYTQDDVIMVSGSGPWRGVTDEQIQKVFETQYQPLLDQAIAANAQFVVGEAAGCDRLVQNYLKEKGYELSQNGQGGQGFKQARQRENHLNEADTQNPDNVQGLIREVIPDAQIVDVNWQWMNDAAVIDVSSNLQQTSQTSGLNMDSNSSQTSENLNESSTKTKTLILDLLNLQEQRYSTREEQLQVERSQQILPILIDYLKVQGKSFVQGETYTAFLDQANQTLNLIDNQSQQPILSAKRVDETWQPLPITQDNNGQITPRLQEKDVQFFLDSKPKIDQALAQKQQASQGRGR